MTENINKLRQLAQEIERRRVALDLSKNQLCQKYGQLGSTKTFGRILNESDDLEGMDIDKQLSNYGAALELINSYAEDPEENKIYNDFDFMRDALTTVTECMQETDNTRLILVTGISGSGKTTFKECLMADARFNRITHAVEATEAWRTKETALLRALLQEIGMFDRAEPKDGERVAVTQKVLPVAGANQLLGEVTERINGRKLVIVIDEAHHLGPQGLNIVKTLINRTRAIFILLAHPALMSRITKESHAECSQLWHNRLFEHIRWPSPSTGDVMEFLSRRGVKFSTSKDASVVAAKIAEDAKGYGCWKFVKRCAKQARKKGRVAFSMGDFAAVILEVKNKIGLGA